MLEVKHVTKSYIKGGTPAIEDISFQVEPGKIHGLIGPNGSGKTTLIKCITGILSIDEGEILLDGEKIYDNPKAKEKIGYVADNCNFFLNYKGKDMIKFYQGMYGKFEEEEFHKLNEMFKIPLTRRVGHLSKGQKMRLSFMLNMAMKPELLVMDEPTSGLDAMAKADLLEQVIAKVDYDETAVIISTHHLYELEKICDTVTMMNIGGIQYQGELDEVKDNIRKYQVVFRKGCLAIKILSIIPISEVSIPFCGRGQKTRSRILWRKVLTLLSRPRYLWKKSLSIRIEGGEKDEQSISYVYETGDQENISTSDCWTFVFSIYGSDYDKHDKGCL